MRRRGLRGWAGAFRGAIEAADGVAYVRSPRIARELSRVLTNGGAATGYYSAGRTPVNGRWLVYSSGSSARRRARFGNGVVAIAETERLAHRLANAMNDADPAQPAPARRGFGWF
jgi:hypothetical protein